MKKTGITSLGLSAEKRIWFDRISLVLLITMLTFLIQDNLLKAQCSLACNGKVQISLDQNCEIGRAHV